MANLFTKHDPYNIHKILGLIVLFHIFYRYYLIFLLGTAFPENESLIQKTVSISFHGILSLSSLLLPLPNKRNFTSPMIWKEFRLHSIVFALRHVVCSLLTLHNIWPKYPLYEAISKYFMIYIVIYCAGYITDKYGNKEKRTTKSMPYPSIITDKEQAFIKNEYSNSQFTATAISVLPNTTLNWLPVVPIQVAPLLMTLVRKGKINSYTYHKVYAFSLWSNLFLGFYIYLYEEEKFKLQVLVASGCQILLRSLRYYYRYSQSIVWNLYIFLLLIVYPIMIQDKLSFQFKSYLTSFLGPLLFVYTLIGDILSYYPLLNNSNKGESIKTIIRKGITGLFGISFLLGSTYYLMIELF